MSENDSEQQSQNVSLVVNFREAFGAWLKIQTPESMSLKQYILKQSWLKKKNGSVKVVFSTL